MKDLFGYEIKEEQPMSLYSQEELNSANSFNFWWGMFGGAVAAVATMVFASAMTILYNPNLADRVMLWVMSVE